MRTIAIPALLLALLAAISDCQKAQAPAEEPPPSVPPRVHVIRDIPVLPGASLVDTMGAPGAERSVYRVGVPFAMVTDYYKRELPKLGYAILNQHGDSATLDLYSRKDRRDLWMHFVKRSSTTTEWSVMGTAAPVPDSSRLKQVHPVSP
ncbi:MAG TPA: hypothetical protein VGI92_10205 [Gemmatimonadales bacterium]|jgi:hypothetical protein